MGRLANKTKYSLSVSLRRHHYGGKASVSLLVRGDFLNWNTLEREVLRWKYIFTSRTIPEFTGNELVW